MHSGFRIVLKFIENIPDCIDSSLRRIDAVFGGIDKLKLFHERSLLAFCLPIPIYVFIIFGPSFTWGHNGNAGWPKIYPAAFLLAGAIIIQLIYFLQNRLHKMAWLQFGLITVLAFFTWIIGENYVHANSIIYHHYYGWLSLIAMFIAIPFANFLRRWKLFALPDNVINNFSSANVFDANKIVDQGKQKKFCKWDVLGAFMLVILLIGILNMKLVIKQLLKLSTQVSHSIPDN